MSTRADAPQVGPAPSPQAGAADCTAVYRLLSVGRGRYRAGLTVTNTADTPVSGPVAFAVPAKQRIDAAHGWTQHDGTATNDTVRALDAGKSTTMTVSGTYTGAHALPTTFTLAGRSCTPTLLSMSGSLLPLPTTGGATVATDPRPGIRTAPPSGRADDPAPPASASPPPQVSPSAVQPSSSPTSQDNGNGRAMASAQVESR
ncbi:cellulose binding domain-containing protein [Catellatospora coxensis]